MPFSYATPGTGPHAGGIGWFDFGNMSMNPGDPVRSFTGVLRDGTVASFDMSLALVSGGRRTFVATKPPTFPGSAFGVVGYTGITGNVAMYSNQGTNSSTCAFTISNITVRDAGGNPIPNYSVVISDAERTNQGESWVWETNGGVWSQVAALGASFPTLTGLGTQKATTTGVGLGTLGSYTLSTQNAARLVLTTTTTDPSAREGFAIGFAITRVTLQKNISARINPADQFALSIAGTPANQNVTADAAVGIQPQTASVYAIPGNAYTLSEAMAPGSVSTLSQYTQIISSQNASPGGTVAPTGDLPITFTPAMGDNVTYTVLNEAPAVYTKTVDKAFGDIGEVLTYTVTINNPNNVPMNNVQMTDATPKGTTYVGNLTVSEPYTGTDPATGITVTSIPANTAVTISWQVKINSTPGIPNPITNVADVAVPGGDSGTTNVAATEIEHARLSVNKSVDRAFGRFGSVLTYTIALKNVGNTAANNVVITDTIPAGTTFIPGSVTGATGEPPTLNVINPIAGGELRFITYQVQVGDTLPTPNPISNTASAAYTYTVDPANPDSASGSGTSIPATTQINTPIVVTTKTVDKASAALGDVLTYTLTLKNSGNVPANNVTITDAVPDGAKFVPDSVVGATGAPPTLTLTDSIAAGGTATVTYQVKIGDTVPEPNPMVNSADTAFTYTVNPTNPDGTSGSAPTATAQTQVNQAVVAVEKAASPAAVKPNDVITYTLTLRNSGNVPANNVVITDAVPAGTAFVKDSVTGASGTPPTLTLPNSIAAGSDAVVTFQVRVEETTSELSPVSNTASAAYSYTANPENPDGANGSSTSNTVVTPVNSANVTTVKTVDKAFATTGEVLTYTLTLKNSGNVSANNVTITDAVPDGAAFVPDSVVGATGAPPTLNLTGPIVAGGSAVVTYQVKIGDTVPESNPMVNTADTAYTYTVDPANPNGASGVSPASSARTQVNQAAVILEKTATPADVKPNGVITYTLTLRNTGNVPASNVVITDAVPAGTAFVKDSVTGASGTPPTLTLANPIAAGGDAVVTFQVQVGNALPDPNPVPNTASAAYTYTADPENPDGATANSTSNTVTTPVNSADLTTAKTVDKAFATTGDVLTYTLTLRNSGNVPANNVVITDAVPTGTDFVEGSVTGAIGVPPTLTLPNPIAAGGSATVSYQVKIGSAVPNIDSVENTANAVYTYTADPENPDEESGSSTSNTVSTQVHSASVATNKAVDKVFAALGEVLTYTLTLRNSGNVPATNVVITDAVPAGTGFVEGSVTGASGTPPTLTLPSPIPAGGSATVSYQMQIGDTLPNPNPVLNTASTAFTYTVNPAAPNGASGLSASNTVSTQVNSAALTTRKLVDKAYASLGERLTYTVMMRNGGNVSANNIVLDDTMPAGTTYVQGSLTGASGEPPTMTIPKPILAGEEWGVTYQVEVGDSLPKPNPMPNTARAAFTHTVDPAIPDGAFGAVRSNTVITAVNIADITTDKTVDKAYAVPGDVLTYTLTLHNTGNVSADNVVITDVIPSGSEFIQGTVVGATGTPASLHLTNPIPANASAAVTFQTRVGDTIPNPNPIANTASTAFTYTVDPESPNGAAGSSVSPTAATQVSAASVSATKLVDRAFADVGDVLTYTVLLENSGNAVANNVVLTDAIPVGTTFVSGSLTGATGTPPTLTLTNPVPAGGTATVTYQVKVGSGVPSTNPVPNTASAAFTFTVDPASPNGASGVAPSNTVSTLVNTANLNVSKRADKAISYIGDIITYRIAVKNTGSVSADNVVLTDLLPAGVSYVPGTLVMSVSYSGTLDAGLALATPIDPDQTVTLSFQARVTAMPNPNPILNRATAAYAYTVDPTDPDGVSATAVSPNVRTVVFRNNYNQQINDLIESVALEQAALAAIANAEGAKIQAVIAKDGITAQQLLCLNKSVSDMMESIAMLEAVLKQKLGVVSCQISETTM